MAFRSLRNLPGTGRMRLGRAPVATTLLRGSTLSTLCLGAPKGARVRPLVGRPHWRGIATSNLSYTEGPTEVSAS